MSREVRICENCGVKNTIDKLECEACGYDLSFIAPVTVEENNGAKWKITSKKIYCNISNLLYYNLYSNWIFLINDK